MEDFENGEQVYALGWTPGHQFELGKGTYQRLKGANKEYEAVVFDDEFTLIEPIYMCRTKKNFEIFLRDNLTRIINGGKDE